MRSLRTKQLLTGIAAIVALFGTCSAALAQEKAPTPPADGPGAGVVVRGFGSGGDAIRFMGFEEGIGGKTVTNAPFTATVSTQITRTLSDGNKIDQTLTGNFARDGQGRTRRDMMLPGGIVSSTSDGSAPRATFINDPVAGTSYILHPDSKVADGLPFRPFGQMRRAMRGEFRAGKRRQNEETTDLGTQTINGVPAQGTRITRTIPAGKIGNEKPIVIVTETWYSPDLQTYVLRKTTNPLSGNTTFELTNIQQGEPDPTLFQVPSGYTVRSRRGVRARRWRDRGTQPAAPQN